MNKPTPSRRTLVKGAAWSVPVVAVGSAVPAMAATGDPTIEYIPGTACKLPGNSCPPFRQGYLIQIEICTDQPIEIEFGGGYGTVCDDGGNWFAQRNPIQIDPAEGRCQLVTFGLNERGSSGNCPIEGTMPWMWIPLDEDGNYNGDWQDGEPFHFYADETPPCDNCEPRPTQNWTPEEETTEEAPVEEAPAEETTEEAPTDTEQATAAPEGEN